MQNSFCSPAANQARFPLTEEQISGGDMEGVSAADRTLIDRFALLGKAEKSAMLKQVRHLLAEHFPLAE